MEKFETLIAWQKAHLLVLETGASLEETKYYPILSTDLKYISEKERGYLISITHEIGRLINGLIRS